MRGKLLWRGLTAVFAFLLIVAIATTCCAVTYEDLVNIQLGISNSGTVTGDDPTALYYTSEFGDFNEASQNKLVEATKQHSISEMEEGAVLLRNENDALPLAADERSVTFFGRASVDLVYGNHSAGNTPTDDTAVSIRQAFGAENFEINPTLWDAYKASSVKRNLDTGDIGEVPSSFYTDALKSSWDTQYNDIAIIVIARESGEGSDFFMKDADGVSELSLHESEKSMLEMVMSSGKFGKVVVLLNTPSAMDLGWLETYHIDACLWMGTPGNYGLTAVVNLLVGKANPSGRLVDTYAANSLSAPATVGSGTNSPTFANSGAINSQLKDAPANTNYYTVYHEGIYVGYKYYETRYEDVILGQGSANDAVGSSFGHAWNYAEEMIYPFGYGLSYTSFTETFPEEGAFTQNEDGTVTIKVTVTNTGSVAGKHVVEIFAQTPYGDYEKTNLVEKSAIQLWCFGKTGVIEPGGSETLEITGDKYFLASYDYTKAKTYILSEGTYYLALGKDAHDALNNVLAAKGATGLTDENGNSVPGNATLTKSWTEAFDDTIYSTSKNGTKVTNQFDDCDVNYYTKDAVKYITRQNWKDSYPKKIASVTATDDMIKRLSGVTYTKPADAPSAKSLNQGVDKGINLLSLRGVAYDDEKWDEYVSQISLEDLSNQLIDAFGTRAIDSVGKPKAKTGDGIDGLEGKLPYGSKPKFNCYPATVVFASTWNSDLYLRRGELIGEEAMFSGFVCVFSIGGDLHRTQFGGRNFEYTSEDGMLGYYVASNEATGMVSKGVNSAIKHFAGNDQEFHRQGLSTFFTEQGFRENNLRIFEGAVTVGGTHALMQGLHRLGCTYDPAHSGLNTGVLRNEWGFQGIAETDGTAGNSYQMRFAESLTAGTSVYCLDSTRASGPAIKKAIEDNDDGNLLLALRRAVKDYHFALVNSAGVNGYTETSAPVSEGMPWWKITLYIADTVLAAVTLACIALFVMNKYGLSFKKKETATGNKNEKGGMGNE